MSLTSRSFYHFLLLFIPWGLFSWCCPPSLFPFLSYTLTLDFPSFLSPLPSISYSITMFFFPSPMTLSSFPAPFPHFLQSGIWPLASYPVPFPVFPMRWFDESPCPYLSSIPIFAAFTIVFLSIHAFPHHARSTLWLDPLSLIHTYFVCTMEAFWQEKIWTTIYFLKLEFWNKSKVLLQFISDARITFFSKSAQKCEL